MSSLLKPSYSVRLGGQVWSEQLIGLELELEAAPLLDRAVVTLPAAAPLKAAVDDPVEVTLNSGEKEERVFSGSIAAIRRGLDCITVTSLNAGGRLAQFRPGVTYENVTSASVIRSLASECGVQTGRLEQGVSLTYYVADPSRNALEHIARLSAWTGALARITAENRLESFIVNAAQAEVALRYGRELLELEQRRVSAPVESFVAAGESGVGSHTDPAALRPVTDFFGGNRPDGPSFTHRWRFEPALRTAQSAATAGAALKRSYLAAAGRGVFKAFLQPHLRPGMVVEIQESPSGLPGGPVWIGGVRHQIGCGGARTAARFLQGGSAFDPAALLGSMAGALRGLL
jgi:hypothetical protein